MEPESTRSGVPRCHINTPLRGVFVFEMTKTKTLKFAVKFDLKLCGKNRTKDNLTD